MSNLLFKCDTRYHKFYIYNDYFVYEQYSILNAETPKKKFTIYYIDIISFESYVESSVVTYEVKTRDGSMFKIAFYYKLDKDGKIMKSINLIKKKRIECLALEDDEKHIQKDNQLIQKDSPLINDKLSTDSSIWDSPGFSNK